MWCTVNICNFSKKREKMGRILQEIVAETFLKLMKEIKSDSVSLNPTQNNTHTKTQSKAQQSITAENQKQKILKAARRRKKFL